jgi:alpha-galactosidase
MTSRRDFVERATLSAMGLALPAIAPVDLLAMAGKTAQAPAFLDLHRPPDLVIAQMDSADVQLAPASAGKWTAGNGVTVTASDRAGALRISLSSPSAAVKRVYLRWRGEIPEDTVISGDAWERAYGDLEWRGWAPDRIMPWYFATTTGTLTHGYGVRTGAASFCYWQIDREGISLCADVRSGSAGVDLGARTLDICDVVCRQGNDGESAFAALHALCQMLCPNPVLPRLPIYGSNDWYWAYGKNSADTVRKDAENLLSLSPAGENRPFVVIDDGWQPGRGRDRAGAGEWNRGNEKFPDIAALAAELRRSGARPGIWIRPLQAPADAPAGWHLTRGRGVLDPTVPEVRQKITDDIGRLRQWGFELMKHDYSTFDLLGQWGNQMGATLTRGNWHFASGADRTTAEIISDFYGVIAAAAGDSLVLGCNTVAHLAAGHFEICRVGDDTSGTDWSRTRKMGVNSLAFRGAQHGAFHVADADCVGVTKAVPWSLNRQWLDLLAHSGTSLFVSLAPDALGADERRDLREALAIAAKPQPLGEPLDWQHSVYPERWRLMGSDRKFDWVGADGAGLP